VGTGLIGATRSGEISAVTVIAAHPAPDGEQNLRKFVDEG
jgi:hypothetical protein